MRTFLIVLAAVSSWSSGILILSPNGGEFLASGTTQTILWEPAGQPAQIRISYSLDNGTSWHPVATVPNTGSYEWTLPTQVAELCLVMIEDPANPSNVWDISDDVFIIYACSQLIPGDLNRDCYVDLQDVADMAVNWLTCSNPYDLNCPCPEPFADCDGWGGNGCEVNLSTDVMNCGLCGNACSLPHSYMSCVDGDCVFDLCHPGYFDCDGDPSNGCEGTLWDVYENNNTFDLARNMGTIAESNAPQSWTAQIVPTGDNDWYRMYLEEGSHTCFPWTGQTYAIQVVLTPPQGAACVDYDVQIYDDSGVLLRSGTAGGCATENITYAWSGTCGVDDSRYFRIRVFGYAGSWSCESYTLQVDMY